MDFGLTCKTVLVLGASKEIGRGIAEVLAECQCQIIAVARDEIQLQQIVKQLACPPEHKHSYISIDIKDKDLLLDKLKKTLINYGQFDIVINNCGGPMAGTLLDAKEQEFISAMHNHLLTNRAIAQLAIPGMQANHFGRIINVLSTSVKTPLRNLGVSNTVRAAVANWAKTLANEVGKYGITVNSILPGYTKTDRLTQLISNTAKNNNCSDSQVTQSWQAEVPLRRFAEPREIAQVVAFLASPLASYINGVALPVDGGRTPCF